MSVERPLLVTIGGGSASGKSTFARLLVQSCKDLNPLLLELDHYYKDWSHLSKEEAVHHNFDHPDSIDFALLYEQLESLLARKPILRPTYDFVTHARIAQTQKIVSHDIIVLEWLFVCYGARLRALADLMIYIDTSDDVRVIRRVRRDTVERGWTFDGVCHQYFTFVKPMHDQYVNPTRHSSDLIVNWNTRNDRTIEAISALLRKRRKNS